MLRRFKLLIASLVFAQSLGIPLAHADNFCDWILQPQELLAHENSLSPLEAIAINDEVTARLRKEGLELERYLKEHPYGSQFDIVIVGGGIHGSILSLAARLQHPQARILVLEAGDKVSRVFGNLAGTFDINSRENDQGTENHFPNSPIQMKDITDKEFANSAHMAFLATSSLRSSGVPILFNNMVQKVSKISDQGHRETYKIHTSSGLSLTTRSIFFATGLGSPSAKLSEESLQLLNQISEKGLAQGHVTPVMYTDHFLKLMAKKNIREAFKETKGARRIAVIGSGDGGNITNEMIFGLCKDCVQSQSVDENLEVYWVGQKAKDAEEFKKSNDERYHNLADSFGSHLRPVPHYLEDFKVRDDGIVELALKDLDANLEVDHVIFASGYKPRYRDIIKNLYGTDHSLSADEVLYKPVLYPVFNDNPSPIGAQVHLSGQNQAEQIFIAGPSFVVDRAVEIDIPEWVLEASSTGNAVSVDVLGRGTAALPKAVFEETDFASVRFRALAPTEQSFSVSGAIKDELSPQPTAIAAHIQLKMELARLVNPYHYSGRILNLEFRKANDSAALEVIVSNFNEKAAKSLGRRLLSSQALVQSVLHILEGKSSVRLSVPFINERPHLEGIKFSQ